MTCFDTDFIINLLRRLPEAETKLEELTYTGQKLTTTPLNSSELYKGAYNSSHPIDEAEKVRKLIETLDMLEFSTASSETFGKLSNELKRNTKHFSQIPGLIVETY